MRLSRPNDKKLFVLDGKLKILSILLLFTCVVVFYPQIARGGSYQAQVEKFQKWLLNNTDPRTGLPYSHVGDQRFEGWCITYDAAIVTLAYVASGKINEAKRIIDFYRTHENIWRLGGIIEAVYARNPIGAGEDWSVRMGSNLWMGIASFHLYQKTGQKEYLEFSKKLADFAMSLQNNDEEDFNFGGIRLGPRGGPNVAGDQHLGYDKDQPSFHEIFATEHNIDAYALFNMLYLETKEDKFKKARDKVLNWLKRVAYNKKEHRFNRGYCRGIDEVVATDVHSWAISALGVEVLDDFERGLAEKMMEFIEENCQVIVSYVKPDGKKITVIGADFVDHKAIKALGRDPMVSPEWTFQLVNAYKRLSDDLSRRRKGVKASLYNQRRLELIEGILSLAIEDGDGLAYPYATLPNAPIGHEYNTPKEGNLSAIGAAYAILALLEFDPLIPNGGRER